jgi:hypothetical protein
MHASMSLFYMWLGLTFSCNSVCSSFGSVEAENKHDCVYTRDSALSVSVFVIAMFSHIMAWLIPLSILNTQVSRVKDKLLTLTMDDDGSLRHRAGYRLMAVSKPMRWAKACLRSLLVLSALRIRQKNLILPQRISGILWIFHAGVSVARVAVWLRQLLTGQCVLPYSALQHTLDWRRVVQNYAGRPRWSMQLFTVGWLLLVVLLLTHFCVDFCWCSVHSVWIGTRPPPPVTLYWSSCLSALTSLRLPSRWRTVAFGTLMFYSGIFTCEGWWYILSMHRCFIN